MNNHHKATDTSEEKHVPRLALSNHVNEKALYHRVIPLTHSFFTKKKGFSSFNKGSDQVRTKQKTKITNISQPHDIARGTIWPISNRWRQPSTPYIYSSTRQHRETVTHTLMYLEHQPLVKRYSTPMKNKTIGENMGEHRIHNLQGNYSAATPIQVGGRAGGKTQMRCKELVGWPDPASHHHRGGYWNLY